jgi:acetyl esterase/lipase
MKKKQWLINALLLGTMLTMGCSMADAATPAKAESKILNVTPSRTEISYIPDIVYSQVPSRGFQNVALQMDIMQPKNNTRKPAILFVTGGGFINANRANGLQLREKLADAGYVVASINYRVAPTATFPQPLEDVKSAIRYLKANADKFGIDKSRVGIVGGSAGGYLSAMAGTTSGTKTFDKGDNLNVDSSVRCAVDLYGISDPTKIGADFPADVQQKHQSAGATEALWVNGSPVFGGKDGGISADPAAAENANPIHYISKSSAPMLLMHGSADTVVSPSQTDLLYQALQQKGIESERYVIPNAQHGGVYWVQDNVLAVITAFFDKHLK